MNEALPAKPLATPEPALTPLAASGLACSSGQRQGPHMCSRLMGWGCAWPLGRVLRLLTRPKGAQVPLGPLG